MDTNTEENKWQERHFNQLNLCGCGRPEEAYNFIRDILTVCDRRGCNTKPPTKEWLDIETEITKLIEKEPGTAAHVLLHFLDQRGVLEHGSGIGGSWLSAAGEEIVDNEPAPEFLDY